MMPNSAAQQLLIPDIKCLTAVFVIAAGPGRADVKSLDSAGGYAYCNSDLLNSTTRNRFIYWSVVAVVLVVVVVVVEL